MREGELLGGQRLQDLTHQPSAGAHTRPQSGPQWAAAPDQPVTVSTVTPLTQRLCLRSNRRTLRLSVVCPRSSPSHPDLQLWRLPWRREEGSRLTSSPRGDTPLCYVSSEHCYQKPGASWEKSEEREKEVQPAAVKEEQEAEQEVKPGSRSDVITL